MAKKLNFTIRQTESAPSKFRLGGDFKFSIKATCD